MVKYVLEMAMAYQNHEVIEMSGGG